MGALFLSLFSGTETLPINLLNVEQIQRENQRDGVTECGTSEELHRLQTLLHDMELKNSALEDKVSVYTSASSHFNH